ncbi:MAG: outer membrane protein assembly factor BamA [Candidatus Binatia bacterium]
MTRACNIFVFLLAGLFACPRIVSAVLLDALDPTRQWRVERIEFSGNENLSEGDLNAVIVTKERPWYRFWEERPVFDAVTFRTDLERLRRFYEANGYYEAAVTYDLDVEKERGLIAVEIKMREGKAVLISAIDVEAAVKESDGIPPPLPKELPVKRGEIFREEEYRQGEQVLRRSFLDAGYAHVETQRNAEVDLDQHNSRIRYGAQPGPVTYFGDTEVKGTGTVEPELVTREFTYRAGEKYSLSKIVESREKILALDLFSTVRVGPVETSGKPMIVPMEVEVAEKPHREIRLALGYGTEDEFRTQLEWRQLNWLGGGQRLSVLAKYSTLETSGAVTFLQPHFLSRNTQGTLAFRHDQETEDTYLRNASRFLPRIDHRFSKIFSGFVGYRLEYNHLSKVDDDISSALGDIRRNGVLSGPTVGFVWNTSDDPFYPRKGHVMSLLLDQAGAIWGGKYSFLKLTAEAKKYVEIGWKTVFASRIKLGFADPLGSEENLPLFERLYSGGEKSVRGYARRRLGPLTANDNPLGGLSLMEGSLELRRPVWRELNGAVFIDFGQVSRHSYDLPVGDLKFSAGFGLSYATPVGPIRLDVGFPFTPPSGDRAWQIHFSIGAYF